MRQRKVIQMFKRAKVTRQVNFRVAYDEGSRIDKAAEAAKVTPTEYARQAVLEKVDGQQAAELQIERKIKGVEDKLSMVGEQIASLAFELRDFRERFDETVITAGDSEEDDH